MEAIKIFPANLSAVPLPGTQWLVVSLVSVSSCPLEAEPLGAEYPGTVSVEQVLPSNQYRNSDSDNVVRLTFQQPQTSLQKSTIL